MSNKSEEVGASESLAGIGGNWLCKMQLRLPYATMGFPWRRKGNTRKVERGIWLQGSLVKQHVGLMHCNQEKIIDMC